MNLDGSNKTVLVADPNVIAGAEWSPDGTQMLYGVRSGNSIQYYLADSDGGNPQPIIDDGGWYPSWSPDGQEIVYSFSENTVLGCRIMKLESGDVRDVVTLTPVSMWGGTTCHWAPDGQHLAFYYAVDGDSNKARVMVVDADGANLHRLNDQAVFFLTWSPDGQHVLVSEGGRTGAIHIVSLEGAIEATLPDLATLGWGAPRGAIWQP